MFARVWGLVSVARLLCRESDFASVNGFVFACALFDRYLNNANSQFPTTLFAPTKLFGKCALFFLFHAQATRALETTTTTTNAATQHMQYRAIQRAQSKRPASAQQSAKQITGQTLTTNTYTCKATQAACIAINARACC